MTERNLKAQKAALLLCTRTSLESYNNRLTEEGKEREGFPLHGKV